MADKKSTARKSDAAERGYSVGSWSGPDGTAYRNLQCDYCPFRALDDEYEEGRVSDAEDYMRKHVWAAHGQDLITRQQEAKKGGGE